MSPRIVLDRVLYELEPRQPHSIERLMVGSTGIPQRKRSRSHFAERREPGAEDRSDGFVSLQVDASNLAGAVIEVEVTGELRLLGSQCESRRAPGGRRSLLRLICSFAEVFRYISARAQESLFFSAPQAYSNRAPGLQSDRLNNSHRLETHR